MSDNSVIVAGEQRYDQGLDPLSDDDASLQANNGGARPRRPLKPAIKDTNHYQVTTYMYHYKNV